jgi:hypothetical protein
MKTEFMGTSYACKLAAQAERLGANPEDFPQAGSDLLLSGRVRNVLNKFREKIKTREGKKNLALRIASGGMINTRPRSVNRQMVSFNKAAIGSRRQ